MSNEEVLGYDSNGNPIYPAKKGYMYTCCLIMCSKCRKPIRAQGGPMHGSLCVPCYSNLKYDLDTGRMYETIMEDL